jgi:hypothetical protein
MNVFFDWWNWTMRGWRTLIANTLLILPMLWEGILVALEGLMAEVAVYKITTYIPPKYMVYYTIISIIINIILRFKSKTPVGKKI